MDLRNKGLTAEQLEQVEKFIIQNKLGYQPFIFTDDLEVGKGLTMYTADPSGPLAYWKKPDPRYNRPIATDKTLFRECNEIYRKVYYQHFMDSLVERLGNNISNMTFGEIGCNSGYYLYDLALRGARKCIGYDIPDNRDLFDLFNRVLNVECHFHAGEWSSYDHRLHYAELEEVDVILTLAVLCHLTDPIYHLAYLCDHARKAIFIYTPVNEDNCLSIKYGQPPRKQELDWPLNFDLDVAPSVPLLDLALREAGFEDIYEVKCPDLPEKWRRLSYGRKSRVCIAFRTKDTKTALTSGRRLRKTRDDDAHETERSNKIKDRVGSAEPKTAARKLIEEGYRGYNIISLGDKFYGLAQSEGKLDPDRVHIEGYRCVVGKSVEEVKQLIGRTSK